MATKHLLLSPTQVLPRKYVETFLGTLCSNAHEPTRGYFPKDPRRFYDADCPPYIIKVQDAAFVLSQIKDVFANSDLLDVLRVGIDNVVVLDSEIKAQKLRIFTLPQEKKVLRNMLEDTTLQETIKDTLENDKCLYYVVGFITMCDAVFSCSTTRNKSKELEANISKALEALAMANALPLSLGNMKVDVRGDTGTSHSWTARYEEESIIAIKYRQVMFKRDIRDLFLRKKASIRDILQLPGGLLFGDNDESEKDEETIQWKKILETGQELKDGETVSILPGDIIPDLEYDTFLNI